MAHTNASKPVSLWSWKHRAVIVALGRIEDVGHNNILHSDIAKSLQRYGRGYKGLATTIIASLVQVGVIKKEDVQRFGSGNVSYSLTKKGREIYDYWNPKMTDLETIIPEITNG